MREKAKQQMSNLRNVTTTSIDGYEVFLMDNKKIILIDGIKNGKSHIAWETITIEAAEKLASDLLNAVFDATEPQAAPTKNWKEIDAARWKRTWDLIIQRSDKTNFIPESVMAKMLGSLSIVEYRKGSELYLSVANRFSELFIKTHKLDYATWIAKQIFEIEDGAVFSIDMSGDYVHREFSL